MTLLFKDHPVPGRITGTFGQTAGYAGYAHRGVDYSAVTGTPVIYRGHASAMVAHVNTDPTAISFGKNVRLHFPKGYRGLEEELFCVYAHLDWIGPEVEEGVLVPPGWLIGRAGSTGGPWASHLHHQLSIDLWMTRDIARSRDPLLYTGKEDSMDDSLNHVMQAREDIRHYATMKVFGRNKLNSIASGPWRAAVEFRDKLKEEGKIP